MHDLIDAGVMTGWRMPPILVKGMKIYTYPGTNRELDLQTVLDYLYEVCTGRQYTVARPPKVKINLQDMHYGKAAKRLTPRGRKVRAKRKKDIWSSFVL